MVNDWTSLFAKLIPFFPFFFFLFSFFLFSFSWCIIIKVNFGTIWDKCKLKLETGQLANLLKKHLQNCWQIHINEANDDYREMSRLPFQKISFCFLVLYCKREDLLYQIPSSSLVCIQIKRGKQPLPISSKS